MPGKSAPSEPSRSRRERRKHVTKGGLVRETAYLYEDEEQALAQRADRERTSKSEIIRRALRAYLRLLE
jgi:hypothetical protein